MSDSNTTSTSIGINESVGMALAYLSYPPGQNPTFKLPDGWQALPDDDAAKLGLDAGWNYQTSDGKQVDSKYKNLQNQFVVFVNEKEKQVVFSFKGSDASSNWRSDLLDAGAAEFAKIWPKAQKAFDVLTGKTVLAKDEQGQDIASPYAGYTFFSAGHSLGGGMAQTFAVYNDLSTYLYNALPIANDTINGKALNSDGKPYFATPDDFKARLNQWLGDGRQVYDVRTPNDIATFYYPTFKRGVYLSVESKQYPQILPGVQIPDPMKLALGLSIAAGNYGALVSLATLSYDALDHMMGSLRDGQVNLTLDSNGRYIVPKESQLLAEMPTILRTQLAGFGGAAVTDVKDIGNGFVQALTATGTFYIKYDKSTGETTVDKYAGGHSQLSFNLNRLSAGITVIDYDGNSNTEIARSKTVINADNHEEITEYTKVGDPKAHKVETLKNVGDTNWEDTIEGGVGQDKYVIPVQQKKTGKETLKDIRADGSIWLGSAESGGIQLAPTPDSLTKLDGYNWEDSKGTKYEFKPGEKPNIGTLHVTGGALGNNDLTIVNFDLSAAQAPGGFAGIQLGTEKTAIESGLAKSTNPFSSGNFNPSDVATSLEQGSVKVFTVFASAVSDEAQTVKVALSGAAQFFGINTGADLLPFANGSVSLVIPAGQDSVTVGLVSTNDKAPSSNLQLTASLVDASGTALDGSASNTLSVNFQGGAAVAPHQTTALPAISYPLEMCPVSTVTTTRTPTLPVQALATTMYFSAEAAMI